MNSSIKTALAVATLAALTACGGGGGGGTTYNPPTTGGSTGGTTPTPAPGPLYSHAELASEFSKRLNTELKGYDVSLVKTNTLQVDYIVVYDKSYKTYDAYYVGAYTPGENLATYLNQYEYKFYYDLVAKGNNTYQDFLTGKLFEIQDSSSMDLEQVAALQEMAAVSKTAKALREQYGMSEEASLDTAKFAVMMNNSQAGSIDVKAMDRFSSKLTGSSITQFQNDIKAGNSISLSKRIELAKEKTGMSDEGIQKLFGQ